MKFLVDMADVSMDRGVSEAHLVSNFFVKITFGEEIQDFRFPWRQVVGIARGRRRFLKRLDDFARDMTAHGRAAAMDVVNGRQQLSRRGLLQEIAGCAGCECVEDVLRILIDSQHDDLRRGQNGLESADTFNTAQPRQIDIH